MSAKKVLIFALLAGVGISGVAQANDSALGAIVGGVIGATIGHNINGRNGAVVGGVLGAATGASIARSNNVYDSRYNDGGYYGNPYQDEVLVRGPRYYAAPPVVYAPPPRVIYAPPPRVVYAPQPRVIYGSPRVVYAPGYGAHRKYEREEWRRDRYSDHDRDYRR